MIIQFTDGSALETEYIAYISEYIGDPNQLRYSITLKNGVVIDDVYDSLERNDVKGIPRQELISIWRGNAPTPVRFEDLVRAKNPNVTDEDIKRFLDRLKYLPFQGSSIEVL